MSLYWGVGKKNDPKSITNTAAVLFMWASMPVRHERKGKKMYILTCYKCCCKT
jgi:hypothetical protein